MNKIRFTVCVDQAVIDLARLAVHSTPNLTLAGFVEASLSRSIRNLERKRRRKFHRIEGLRLTAGRPATTGRRAA